ncbi:MAG: SH3 domain-containing protein [SAR324 cluster bacterium]|nr:SH3 domain-containing protein [SAR324 cluster bacterium]
MIDAPVSFRLLSSYLLLLTVSTQILWGAPNPVSEATPQIEAPPHQIAQATDDEESNFLLSNVKERVLYELAKQQNRSNLYQYYLEKFPKGVFAGDVAQKWLERLRQSPDAVWNQPTVQSNCPEIFQILGKSLNIREKPNLKSAKLGSYSPNDLICVLEKQQDWNRTPQGWVHAAYMKPDSRFSNGLDLFLVYQTLVKNPEYLEQVKTLRESTLRQWALNQRTIEAYDRYLKNYGSDPNANELINTREDLRFEQALAQHTATAYDLYLQEYPKGNYRSECVKLREHALFQWTLMQNTQEAYETFLQAYPSSSYRSHIRQLLRNLTSSTP